MQASGKTPISGPSIAGTVRPGFEAVREAFAVNFAEGLEVGACVCVYVDGAPVVDLWGGYQDPGLTTPWESDTLVNLMSVAKGVAALCIHKLSEEGLVDLDRPLALYWPEFAQNGKEGVLVRHALDHRAGVPVLDDPLWPGAVYDRAAMIGALERQPLLTPAGAAPAYHTITMSFLLGELVRRVTGDALGAYFRRKFGGPLDLDYWLGLPSDLHGRCARFIPWVGYNNKTSHEGDGPPALLVRAWAQFDPSTDDDWNAPHFRKADLPGVSGHGNARAIARLYGMLACGGILEGREFIRPETLERATELQWFEVEPVLTHHYRMGMGFTLNSPDAYMGPNARAYGHVGAGGSIGMCDPDARIGFAYGMNRMHPTRDNGPRARRLIDAVYACL